MKSSFITKEKKIIREIKRKTEQSRSFVVDMQKIQAEIKVNYLKF